jgi:hypothetical protein
VSEDTIRRAIATGALHAKKVGESRSSKHLIGVADLRAWFDGLVDA